MKQGTIFVHPDKLGFYVLNTDVSIGDAIEAHHFISFGNVDPPVDGYDIPEWLYEILMHL